MSIFEKQIKFIEDFESTIFRTFEQTVQEFDFVLKDYVINKQLFRQGIDGDGKKLPGYKRTTIRAKLRKGDPIDRTTLRNEGEFYSHIQIDAFSDHFEITSNVEHDKFIIKRYGRNVLKITEDNFQEFMRNFYLPNLKKNGIN
jgi:hypothetical protein